MDKSIFFNQIETIDFLKEYFMNDDWYKLPGQMKDILKENIKQSVIKSDIRNTIVNGIVYIGENCVFGDNVVIDGPAYIDDGAEIATGAYIRAGSYIGKECSVGHAAEVKASIMMSKSKVANHTFVGDSILGYKARIGGHSETANRRFDQAVISINIDANVYNTELDKYGAIIGESARLGGGVFTFPGTAIGIKSFVATGVNVGGFIPANKFVKLKADFEIVDNQFQGELHNKSKIYE